MTGPLAKRKRPAVGGRTLESRFGDPQEVHPQDIGFQPDWQVPWPWQQVGGVVVERVLPRLAVDDIVAGTT